jgi:hypothetical protein
MTKVYQAIAFLITEFLVGDTYGKQVGSLKASTF